MGDATDRNAHLGTYSRGYLPHFDHQGLIQAVTFRLADALPQEVGPGLDAARIEAELGQGHGSCVLRNPRVAAIVQRALEHFDGIRYCLGPWVIMPNHVHLLVRPLVGYALGAILHSWKSFTAKKINALLGGSGAVWQREYFDRMIRNYRHLLVAARYVYENPVVAGLVERAEDWPFSSVRDPTRVRALLRG